MSILNWSLRSTAQDAQFKLCLQHDVSVLGFDNLGAHSSVKWSKKYCYKIKLPFEAE